MRRLNMSRLSLAHLTHKAADSPPHKAIRIRCHPEGKGALEKDPLSEGRGVHLAHTCRCHLQTRSFCEKAGTGPVACPGHEKQPRLLP